MFNFKWVSCQSSSWLIITSIDFIFYLFVLLFRMMEMDWGFSRVISFPLRWKVDVRMFHDRNNASFQFDRTERLP